ncbi:dual specificity protein kinase [Pelomyxa schiedti]|nr:dual specificity protein kinase [Pelomyxa schiedti]
MAANVMPMQQLLSGPPEIPREDIIFNLDNDRIGGGAYGDVYRAIVKGIKVAIKVPKKQQWETEAELQAFKDEVAILKGIFHTNVVLFLGACTAPGNVIIVLERMMCDVDRLIHKPLDTVPPELQNFLKGGFSLYRKLKIAYETVLGVSWLHDICNIVHRDLKPANLLLDDNFHVKVTDFGFSEIYRADKRQCEMKGTALYIAPEIWKLEVCSKASDVYSFGLILWELLTEEDPFAAYNDIEPFYQDVIVRGLRPIIPAQIPFRRRTPESTSVTTRIPLPTSLALLMQECWNTDPKARPTMPQLQVKIENIILEILVESPAARTFWSTYLRGEGGSFKEVVTWDEFMNALSYASAIPAENLKPLQSLFCPGDPAENNPGSLVSLSRFDLMEKWFGDFFLPEGKPILFEMLELQQQPWFMQDVSKEYADLWLGGRDDGYFLVRLSNSNPQTSPFTISKRKSHQNVHRRIQRLTSDTTKIARYSIETGAGPGYLQANTVSNLVERLREIRSLTTPCPREIFASAYVGVRVTPGQSW